MKARRPYPTGEDNKNTFYGDNLCLQAFDLRATGLSYKAISERLGLGTEGYVVVVLRGKCRPYLREQWLAKNPGREQDIDFNLRYKISDDDCLKAFEMAANGQPQRKIAQQFGVKFCTINLILSGKQRPYLKQYWDNYKESESHDDIIIIPK